MSLRSKIRMYKTYMRPIEARDTELTKASENEDLKSKIHNAKAFATSARSKMPQNQETSMNRLNDNRLAKITI